MRKHMAAGGVSIPQAGLDILKEGVGGGRVGYFFRVSIPQAGLDILKAPLPSTLSPSQWTFQSRKQD